ncbi:hypothetical protein BACSP_00892 [Bacillus sp. T2.9-1]|nr:hypothetical protein BACSP_00892 [Bacillus sp. T2.9-1]
MIFLRDVTSKNRTNPLFGYKSIYYYKIVQESI